MTNVFFTSDLHFGHKMVAELRGFDDPEAHDQAIIDRWNATVTKRDQVWVLGDVAVSSPTRALTLIQSLPGTKHLISGNHDGCHPMHSKFTRQLHVYLEAFESVSPFVRRKMAGTEVFLCHFPYEVDRGIEARYPQYRLHDLGAQLLHGHTHSVERRTSDHEIHVGVDAWDLTPVPMETIIEMINEPN